MNKESTNLLNQDSNCENPNGENQNGQAVIAPAKYETKVYALRWWIGVFMTLQIIVIRMLMSSIGVINNVYTAYFNISYYAVDWFTLMQAPGVIFSSIVLALLSFNSITRFRKLFLIMAFSAVVACSFSMITFAHPNCYWLIYVGQLIVAFGFEASTAFGSFASSWFPENQIGFVLSLKSLGMSSGALLSFLVPVQLVDPPPAFLVAHKRNLTEHFTRNETDEVFDIWAHEVYWKFSVYYSALLFVSLIVLVFVLIFVNDLPLKPPTIAQALARAQNHQNKPTNILKNLGNFFEAFKSIWFDKVFILSSLTCSIVFGINFLQRLIMGEVFRDLFVAQEYGTMINKFSGYVLVVYEFGCILGSVLSARLMDHFKKHKLILYVALILSAVFIAGLAVGQYLGSFASLFIFNAMLGVAICSCHIPIYDIVLQYTYPANPAFVLLLFNSSNEITIIIIGQLSRFILNYISGIAIFVYIGILILLSLILSIFLQPKYKRHEASLINTHEEAPLLSND